MESDYYRDCIMIDHDEKSITGVTIDASNIDPKDDEAIKEMAELICSIIPGGTITHSTKCDVERELEIQFHAGKALLDIPPAILEKAQQNLEKLKTIVEAKNYSELQHKYYPYTSIFGNEKIEVKPQRPAICSNEIIKVQPYEPINGIKIR